MKRVKIFSAIVLLAVLFAACRNTASNKEASTEETQTAVETQTSTPVGTYADDSYTLRGEGYDWVGVRVKDAGDGKLLFQVRSRADKKQPTCTWDQEAFPSSENTWQTYVEGQKVFFTFEGDTLTISAETEAGENALYFFCSGGATVAGKYTRISGDLDAEQVDPTVYAKVVRLQGIGFNVSSTRSNGSTEITITPFGLEEVNRTETHIVDGYIVDVEAEDLNADGSPELLVYTQAEGSGSYGNVIAYSVNNMKSMSMVYFQPITENPKLSEGYMGHDEFRVVETSLVQRFPIYREGDSNANPTGGTRQISYKLVNGENMRRFEVKNVTDY